MLRRLPRSTARFLVAFLLTGLFVTALSVPVVRAQQQAVGELPPVVYTARVFGHQISPVFVDRRAAVVERAESGSLRVRSSTGEIRTLVEPSMPGAPTDVSDPAVSYDASTIVFAGFSPTDEAWRIYEVGADGSGLRQVTKNDRDVDLTRFGDAAPALERYDDFDPTYLPDGRIVFVSTRYPGVAPDLRFRTTNLYIVDADGYNVHRITSERFGADTPTVDPQTGEIVYSRWWRSPPTGVAADAGGSDGQEPGAVDPAAGDEVAGDPAGNRAQDDGRAPPPLPPEEDGGMPLPVEGVPPGSPGYGQPGGTGTNGPFATATPNAGLDGINIADFLGLNNWFLASIRPDGDGMRMFSGAGLDRRETQAYRPSFRDDGTAIGFFLPTTPFLGQPGNFGLRIFSQGAGAPEELGGPQNFLGVLPGDLPDDFLRELANGRILGADFFYSSAEPLPDGRLLVSGARVTDHDWGVFVQMSAARGTPPRRAWNRRGRSL